MITNLDKEKRAIQDNVAVLGAKMVKFKLACGSLAALFLLAVLWGSLCHRTKSAVPHCFSADGGNSRRCGRGKS